MELRCISCTPVERRAAGWETVVSLRQERRACQEHHGRWGGMRLFPCVSCGHAHCCDRCIDLLLFLRVRNPCGAWLSWSATSRGWLHRAPRLYNLLTALANPGLRADVRDCPAHHYLKAGLSTGWWRFGTVPSLWRAACCSGEVLSGRHTAYPGFAGRSSCLSCCSRKGTTPPHRGRHGKSIRHR